MNWPKDFVVECATRPGTHMSKMFPGSVSFKKWSAKRYTFSGAKRALKTLAKHHSGMDWQIRHHAVL